MKIADIVGAEYLGEAVRPGYLYHGTTVDGLFEMLDANTIEDKTYFPTTHKNVPDWALRKRDMGENYITGVSMTRNPYFARKWCSKKGDGAVLVLDGEKLKHRHRIIPISFWSGRGVKIPAHGPAYADENEEFCVGKIAPLSAYLIEVQVNAQAVEREPLLKDITEFMPGNPKLTILGQTWTRGSGPAGGRVVK